MAATNEASGSAAYALALFEATEAREGIEGARTAGEALAALAEAWRKDRRLRAWFLSSQIPAAERERSLETLGASLPGLLGRFLRLLQRRNRLAILPAVEDAYRGILDARLGRVPVLLTTAVPLPANRLGAWERTLRAATGREPVFRHRVRPEIVAGAVLRVGDLLADGSVRRRLERLERGIVARGTHAIQS